MQESIPKDVIRKNKLIYIRLKDYVSLFLSQLPGGCCMKYCWPNYKYFNKLIKKGREKLDEEMNIVDLIRGIRKLKILLQNSLRDSEIQVLIKHDEQNLIEVDDSDE